MTLASLALTTPKQTLPYSSEVVNDAMAILHGQLPSPSAIIPNFKQIAVSLHKINRTPLDDDLRTRLTEHALDQYLLFIRAVRNGDFALSPQQTTELPGLTREFAYSAKLLVMDGLAHSKEEFANLAYRAISILGEHLRDYSAQHYAQPGALWAEINRLYHYAEAHALTDFRGNRPDKGDIDSRFKQALLLQAAQPAHLNDQEFLLIDTYLYRWSSRAQLNHQESREFNTRYFYVDLESEAGAMSARQIRGAGNDFGVRALNPLPLIDQARKHMNQLRSGTAANIIGFGDQTSSIDAFMALRKATVAWKQASSRRFERAACAIEARTAFGLTAIHSYLRSADRNLDTMVQSQMVNISKLGACISIADWKKAKQLAVGDVIIHQRSNDSGAKLCIVRWLKRVGSSMLFGIEFVLGNLQPVMLRVHDQVSEALLVSTADSDSLITHKGYCDSNTPVRLKNSHHGVTLDARAQALMRRGQYTDQIRIKRSQVA